MSGIGGFALQCARVDVLPNRDGSHGLPTVQDGSTTAACVTCRAQVWVSKPARELVTAGEMRPVCDACKPAHEVHVTPERHP